MSRRCSSAALPQPASPLDSDDLLREILVRLPPRPSSLSRASLVCTRWRHLVSDPCFRRHIRAHHRKPPLLGVFSLCEGKYRFIPTQDPPDRIPERRFSLPHEPCHTFHGCRNGLAVLLDRRRYEAIVWDPLTGHQLRVHFPLGSDNRLVKNVRNAAVLPAAGSDSHVGGDGHLSPFRLAMVWVDHDTTCAIARLYESESGLWGNIVTTEISELTCLTRSAVLVRNSLCWHLSVDSIIEFDFERDSLVVIKKPPYNQGIDYYASCHIVRTENGGLGLAILSEQLCIQIWEMKSNCRGVRRWMLGKTIQLEEQLSSLRPCTDRRRIILGYDEDTNMAVLSTDIGDFVVQLDSSEFRNVPRIDQNHPMACYPYSNFYSPGCRKHIHNRVLDLYCHPASQIPQSTLKTVGDILDTYRYVLQDAITQCWDRGSKDWRRVCGET